MQDLIERYIDSWNVTDPQLRRTLVDQLWADDASYVDPLVEVHGRDGIDSTMGVVQAQFAGLRFALAGPVDWHHQQARFTWNLGLAGAEPVIVGFDVAVAGDDGRLVRVHGFLDRVPA